MCLLTLTEGKEANLENSYAVQCLNLNLWIHGYAQQFEEFLYWICDGIFGVRSIMLTKLRRTKCAIILKRNNKKYKNTNMIPKVSFNVSNYKPRQWMKRNDLKNKTNFNV